MIQFSHRSVGSAEDRAEVARLIAAVPAIRGLRGITEMVVTIHPALAEPTEVRSMHTNWRPEYLPKVATPDSLPRQEPSQLCPEGSRLVEVECIEKHTGGMGSYYGFEGFFVSLVLSPDLQEVMDARAQRAT